MSKKQDSDESTRFDKLRDTIEDGDVILFRGRTSLGRLIRWVTRAPYSHAGLAGWWEDRLMVMEAKRAGVVASRLSHVVAQYRGQAELFRAVGALDPSRKAAVAAAREELGKHYATWAVFRIWRRLWFRIPGRHDPTKPREKFVCSGYVNNAWLSGGVSLVPDQKGIPTPGELAKSPHLKGEGPL